MSGVQPSVSIVRKALYYPAKILFWVAFFWFLIMGGLLFIAGLGGLLDGGGFSMSLTIYHLVLGVVILGGLSILLYNRRHRRREGALTMATNK